MPQVKEDKKMGDQFSLKYMGEKCNSILVLKC